MHQPQLHRVVVSGLAGLLLGGGPATAADEEGAAARLRIGVEGKAHVRDSEDLRIPSPFPFSAEMLPPGEQRGFMETVNAGSHLELSNLNLQLDAEWGEGLAARARLDFLRLHDRNPTSSGREIDVDELWVRLGREGATAVAGASTSVYTRFGKFPKFERQNDRHLESYGLVATAFNRFEDIGAELGVETRNFYLKASLTQGNPLFLRDPGALAGDNGTDELRRTNPDPLLKTGFPILYDAVAEGLDFGGQLEAGLGLGLRLGERGARARADLLLWGYERDLAESVGFSGTFYGGDLDLLRGPANLFPLPITGDRKRELGGNLWLYSGGLSLFGQYVDQDLAGMQRLGWEAELAWRAELPLYAALEGRQLFPYVQPALRFSRLEPRFEGGSPLYPAASVRWSWDKWDLGVRLGIVSGVDLTAEWTYNRFRTAAGPRTLRELLVTLRFRSE
jgi:hypothetical protein